MKEQSKIRVLFTSVGRRIELIQAFHNAANKKHIDIVIYGADFSPIAPALFFCDEKRTVCRIKDPQYISELLAICKKEQITLLIPTIDTDLLLLSQNKEQFEQIGTQVLISSPSAITICRDKRKTAEFFEECGLHTPKPIDRIEDFHYDFPCFIKPKDGSSSIDAYKVNTKEDLITFSERVSDYIIQPFIEGVEYTIDIFCDFNAVPIFIIPRIRMAVRSGEVLQTKIVLDSKMIEECKTIVRRFKPCGPITVQLIKEKVSGDNYYIEINPRYGGGAPLSIKAGADSAQVLLDLLSGQEIQRENYPIEENAVFSRFDQSICVNPTKERERVLSAVIFDLDDTLYRESDYVRSGYQAIASLGLPIDNMEEKLWNAFLQGKPAMDTVLEAENCNDASIKEKCLETYRNHKPNICLYEGVKEFLYELKEKQIKTGVITDGRPEGQRAKIEALGLASIIDEILVTDELGQLSFGINTPTLFRKPSDIPFRMMKEKLGVDYEEMVYIGDNPKKDIKTPLKLGMAMLYFENAEGLYSHGKFGLMPKFAGCGESLFESVKNWTEIKQWIQKRL